MAKATKIKLTADEIAEIKRQNKLIHTKTISLRSHPATENRNPYQRDYARIIYSSAFRRLQGKMQILGVESTAFFRNRLTHSLEVAQIAKGIRWQLDKAIFRGRPSDPSDLFLLDAAALAHDIGHPAFGHKGERVLNDIAQSTLLHFEGNAQNFRVLCRLENKSPEYEGLNLTLRTLLAINKYIVKEGPGIKKFMYAEDYEALNELRAENNLLNTRTLDVQIIELADDIAYAVHDLDDALAQGFITLDELIYEIGHADDSTRKFTIEQIGEAGRQMSDIIAEVRDELTVKHFAGTLQRYSQLIRKMLVTKLTDTFILDIGLGEVAAEEAAEHGTIAGQYELKLRTTGVLVKLLSKKIFAAITRKQNISIYESRGEIVIRALYGLYTDQKRNRDGQLLPQDYRPVIKHGDDPITIKRKYAQSALDYIGGMMDYFAMQQYERYFRRPFDDIPLIKPNCDS